MLGLMEQQSEDTKARATKRKKVGVPKDPNAPKRPVTAYIIFSTEVRQKLHSDQPEMGFVELMRHIGGLWNKLPAEEKQRYFDAAEKDKERYMREYSAYQQTESYKQFMKLKYTGKGTAGNEKKKDSHKSHKEPKTEPPKSQDSKEPKSSSTRPAPLSSQQDFVPGTDIPIFTEQFLQHNREMESQLRKLRHDNRDLEEENALLSRHVESMKATVEKLRAEMAEQQSRNTVLKDHLQALREVVVDAFHDSPLPGTNETPTVETVDGYLGKLQVAVADGAGEYKDMVATMREVAERLEEEVGKRLESKDGEGGAAEETTE